MNDALQQNRPTPLRVALFTGNYNYIKDGVSLSLNRLVGYLLRQGVEVLVVAPGGKEPAFEATGDLHTISSIPFPFRNEYRISYGLPPSAVRRVKDFKPDIMHIAIPDAAGFHALRLAKRWNIPAVATYHTRFDMYFQYYGMKFMESTVRGYLRYFYARCEHVYPPSQSMVDILLTQGMISDFRIWTRGVDRTRFSPVKRNMGWRRYHGIADDEAIICFASRLVKEKNVIPLMRVFAELRKRGNRFRSMVFGDGPAADLMKSLSIDTIFTGTLHGDELATAYASSDIFMFPSDSETFGNVTLEAMASGLACICADASGSRSLVAHDKSGYLLSSTDEQSFVSHAEKLMNDPVLRKTMGAEALRSSSAYDWDVINHGLLQNYHAALAEVKQRGTTRTRVPWRSKTR